MTTDKQIQEAAEVFSIEMMHLRTSRTDIWERTPEGAKLLKREFKNYAFRILKILIRKIGEMQSQSQWIPAKERLPEIPDGKLCSPNVWAWDGIELMIMCLAEIDGCRVWCNCYGEVNGDGEYDDEYYVTHWKSLEIPEPPKAETR